VSAVVTLAGVIALAALVLLLVGDRLVGSPRRAPRR
jgi:hypothetical protein